MAGKPTGRPNGRPSTYTPEAAQEVCRRVAAGEGLEAIGKVPGLPSRDSIRRWLNDHPDFRAEYARAREQQADAFFEEAIAIADDARYDWAERAARGGGTMVLADYEHIARSKLRVDTRRWAAARIAPWKYGDRVAVEQKVSGQVEHKLEHALVADAEALAQVLGILAPVVGNGHDKTADDPDPTLQ